MQTRRQKVGRAQEENNVKQGILNPRVITSHIAGKVND